MNKLLAHSAVCRVTRSTSCKNLGKITTPSARLRLHHDQPRRQRHDPPTRRDHRPTLDASATRTHLTQRRDRTHHRRPQPIGDSVAPRADLRTVGYLICLSMQRSFDLLRRMQREAGLPTDHQQRPHQQGTDSGDLPKRGAHATDDLTGSRTSSHTQIDLAGTLGRRTGAPTGSGLGEGLGV
jgi:hypothetical protein